MSLSHRERVSGALNRQEPDRVPVDPGLTRSTGALLEPCEALAGYLGEADPRHDRDDFGKSKQAGDLVDEVSSSDAVADQRGSMISSRTC
jgi:hypothetical protein